VIFPTRTGSLNSGASSGSLSGIPIGQGTLVPNAGEMVLHEVRAVGRSRLLMVLRSAGEDSGCPACAQTSRRVHSRHSDGLKSFLEEHRCTPRTACRWTWEDPLAAIRLKPPGQQGLQLGINDWQFRLGRVGLDFTQLAVGELEHKGNLLSLDVYVFLFEGD
jgi:hypothetical protein